VQPRPDAALRPAPVGEPLVLCTVAERVGGPVTLASGACPGGGGARAWRAANPAVALPPAPDALPPGAARLGADAAFAPIAAGFPGADDGVLVLRSTGALGASARLCAGDVALRTVELAAGAGPADARCFRWDERTRLRSLPNEPDAPVEAVGAAELGGGREHDAVVQAERLHLGHKGADRGVDGVHERGEADGPLVRVQVEATELHVDGGAVEAEGAAAREQARGLPQRPVERRVAPELFKPMHNNEQFAAVRVGNMPCIQLDGSPSARWASRRS